MSGQTLFPRISGIAIMLGLTFAACAPPSGGGERVVLGIVSSQPAYAAGATVRLRLTLENAGAEAIALSPIVDGTIRVVSLRRDGVDVATRETLIDFEDDLASILEFGLKTVAPGERADFDWISFNDRLLHGQTLQTVAFLPEDDHKATLYDIGAAGRYELVAVYSYPGPKGPTGNTFSGTTNEATVRFIITP